MIPQRYDRREPPEAPTARAERSELDVSLSDGTVVVAIVEGMLLTTERISAFEVELGHLLDAGHRRVALDFGQVSRLSRRAVNALIRVQQRYREAGVGLKLRAVRPKVAAGLGLTGASASVELPATGPQPAANGAPKPAAMAQRGEGGRAHLSNGHEPSVAPYSDPRSGTFELLAWDLVSPGAMYVDPTTVLEFDIAQVLGSAPAAAPPAPPGTPGRPSPELRPAQPSTAAGPAAAPSHVKLRVRSGKAAGHSFAVHGPRFVVGRDASCHLRAKSSVVSRVHASIELRDGRVFVRDEGSSNGTMVNGRTFRGEAVEAADGDQLDIGPMQFTIVITRASASSEAAAEDVEPAAGPRVPEPSEADFWAGVQFSCAVQPGSVARLSPASAVRTEAAPIATASHGNTWPGAPVGGGQAALEHLLREMLRILGSGVPGPAPAPPASPAEPRSKASPPTPSPPPRPRTRSRPAAPPTPPTPAPPAEPVSVNEPAYAVATQPGTPFDSEVALLMRSAGTLEVDEDPPAVPNAASSVGFDLEKLLEEAESDPDEAGSIERFQPRPNSGLTGQRALDLPVECPHCGEEGHVPISRMGSFFRCHACQTQFRIEPRGTKGLNDDVPRTPMWKKCAAAAAVLVLLLVGRAVANSPLLFGSPSALTSYAFKALTQDAPGRVIAITAPGTERSARRWTRVVGPILKGLSERGAAVEIAVVSTEDQSAETTITFTLDPSAGPAPKAGAEDAGKAGPRAPPESEKDGVLKVPVYWYRAGGTWYLDARRSLRGSSALAKKYAQMASRAH